jgi:lipoprotein-anchoring transpeptidase ErfK/SrfK
MTPAAAREAARRATGRRLVVSVDERRLWLMEGARAVYTAPVAVGKGTRLVHAGRAWRFVTPPGVRRVRGKAPNPVWVPPDWHYAELAKDSAWTLIPLRRGRPTIVPGQGRLEVRGDRIVHVAPNGREEVIPADEEVLFGRTLYMPPMGTANRRIAGELGAYKLDIGDGYMLHGTPHKSSIGRAATHGCIRLGDADIAYLYRTVAVGTPVYIY